MPELSYREAVRDALAQAMREDDDVFIMGEDIAEMGGSMGVTQGMLDEFGPERVRNTPISEMAIVGAGIGAAMQGMRPVVEIMYEDFLTLSMEQIVNQAAKHRYMSGGQLKVPLTIRTQGGAGWSPGAQHAQQVEAWFVHVPGLKVVFASTPADVRGLLWSSIYDDNPVIFFEHRTLYAIKDEVPEELEPIPLGQGARPPRGHGRDRGRDRAARARGAHGRGGGGGGGHLGRGRRPAHAAAAGRGGARRVGEEDEPLRGRARGGHAHGLRRRGRGGRAGAGVRLARRADRARRREVRAAPVRAGDGAVRRPARGRRAGGDSQDGRRVASEVKLPRLGQGMESGTIVKWLKSEGERVEKGEPLYELDTDKVTQEVEADASGVLLKIAVAEGEVPGRRDDRLHRRGGRGGRLRPAKRGRGCARWTTTAGGGLARARPRGGARARAPGVAEQVAEARPQPAQDGGRVKASPLARRIARERGIDLRRSPGTGPEGRIVAEDVERAEAGAAPAPAPAAPRRRAARSSAASSRTSARRSRAG